MPSFSRESWLDRVRRPLYGAHGRARDVLLGARIALNDAIRHLHGPREIDYAEDELIVLCLVRNGELWIESFLDHYFDLGARHIVFVDNGSTDDTVAMAARRDRVSIWATDLSFHENEIPIRRWLVNTFGENRWSLWADIDELFEYPYSGVLELSDFLRYLDRHSYTAVAAHMLDMFSDRPFSELESRKGDSLKDKYRFYDLSDIERTRDVYWITEDRVDSPEISATFGGIRKRIFGSRNLLQTKHPLLRAGDGLRVLPYDGHFSTNATYADVSGVLLHYKFLSNLREQSREAIRLGNHWNDSEHYRGFLHRLTEDPDLCLRTESASELESLRDLVEKGYLTVSPKYREWVEAHAEAGEGVAGPSPPHT